MPTRIQRRRTAGWRMPAGTVYVGRPTVWGNPWRAGDEDQGVTLTAAGAVNRYSQMLGDPQLRAAVREQLAGRDLACWCPLTAPCHADVLLAIANPPTCEPDPWEETP